MKKRTPFEQVYFDCNATTSVLLEAADAAIEAMRVVYGNPSSTHSGGLQARHILESTRKKAAVVIGASSEEVIFTSGATEAIQMAVFSVLRTLKDRMKNGEEIPNGKLLYCVTEHKAVPVALRHWAKMLDLPFEVRGIPVDRGGQVKLNILRKELEDAVLLCTMAVNNETGVIQNLSEIERILVESNSQVYWLVDCVQALGKQDLQLNKTRINYATFSGHKLYAPKGIGFLYASQNSPVIPLIVGGGQEHGHRSGTENLPGVAAFGAVLDFILEGKEHSRFQSQKRLVTYRNELVSTLKKAFPSVVLNTPLDLSVPTTLNFSIPGFRSDELMDVFDSAGLRVSAGSACSSSKPEPSYVLEAMGLNPSLTTSALRLSFGPMTPEEEIKKGCQFLRDCGEALKTACLMDDPLSTGEHTALMEGIIHLRIGGTNTWIIADQKSRSCVMIDPTEVVADRLQKYIRCQNLKVLAILDTHSHADHESVGPALRKTLIQSRDTEFDELGWPKGDSTAVGTIMMEDGVSYSAIRFSSSSQVEKVLVRVPTPGHTRDSVTYCFGNVHQGKLKKEDILFAFVGDMILSGGLGRTNFDISAPKALLHSLRKLKDISGLQTLLCSAHDYSNSFASLLNQEVADNPLLAMALGPLTPLTEELFLTRKKEIDSQLGDLASEYEEVVCGVTSCNESKEEKDVTLSQEKFYSLLRTSHIKVVDIRESQEFLLFKDWKGLGFKTIPKNIPISRFLNFVPKFLSHQTDEEIVLLCRSGGRSMQVAKAIRKLGVKKIWSLEGGLALLTPSKEAS